MQRRAGVKMHHGHPVGMTSNSTFRLDRWACSPALTGVRVLRPMLALLALFEAIAVAVHFENVDVVS
jgi:hypothetical protein